MQWDDIGYLVSKNKYNENSLIAEVYTKNHGKCSGIIFGATSKKIKNYLEIGNKLSINYNFKVDGRIGYFKVEILKATSPFYFDNKRKLLCIISAMDLVKNLTVEFQENIKIFNIIDLFFENLNTENWTVKYIFWELDLLELIGFKLDLEKISNLKSYQNNIKKIDNKDILKLLNFIGEYLEKNIFKPNNINYPISRLEFINLFK